MIDIKRGRIDLEIKKMVSTLRLRAFSVAAVPSACAYILRI
jgi:hypothetical protein